MKKIILSLLFVLLFSTNVLCQTQVINMTEDITPTTDDLLYVVNDPVGVPGDRKVQIGNLPIAWGTTSTELGYTSGVTSAIQGQIDGKEATDVNLTSIAGLTFADVSIIELTGVGGTAVVTSGGANRILGSNADNTATEFKSSLTGITLGGFTASYGVESNASGELVSVQPTGTGLTVRQTSPTFVTPVLGAATATSLLATGIVDGTAPIVITTTSSDYQLGATYKSGYTFINPTSSSASNSVILPAAAAGLQYVVGNYAGKTGVLTVKTKTGSGVQYIDLDGVLTANTGHIQATAVAGNFACFIGLSDSVWKAIPTKGVWTKD